MEVIAYWGQNTRDKDCREAVLGSAVEAVLTPLDSHMQA